MTTPPGLAGPGPPRRNGELALDTPWPSTASALAAAVADHAFAGDREPFRQQLITAIAAEPGRPYREAGPPRSKRSCPPCPNSPRPGGM